MLDLSPIAPTGRALYSSLVVSLSGFAAATTALSAGAHMNAKRPVFVVDDDPSVLVAMERLLRSAGFEVLTFSSGQAFLDATAPETMGCAILDVQMPGMNGLELQDRLRAGGYELRLIFLTAYPKDKDRRRALAGGAAAYLEKPVSADVLLPALSASSPS